MIKINLISGEDKQSVKWEKINKTVISYSLKVIIIQFIFAVIFISALIYLNYQKERAEGELALVESTKETLEIKKMESTLKEYDKSLKVVTKIHNNHIRWVETMDYFSSLVPKGIKINSIRFKPFEIISKNKDKSSAKVEYDENKYVLRVEGDALKREDLVAFEKNLNDAKVFKMIETESPDYVKYVKSENINFNFNFEVAKSDLRILEGE